MAGGTSHSLGAVTLAIAGAAALGMTPAVTPSLPAGVKTVLAEAKLADTESWIMGGSGLPIPPPSYLTELSERYVNPSAYPDFSGGSSLFDGQTTFPVSPDHVNPLFTPEGLYPFTGVKQLELDPSVAQGVSILNSTIDKQTAAGNDVVAVGYSQSATINSLEMKDLLASDNPPDANQLQFVLLGDPSAPNGGLLTRFDLTTLPNVGDKMPELTIPSLGVTFYQDGATPADAPWDTAVYTQEYDGFADFPKYPINFLSDLNALLGIVEVHGTYPTLTADKIGTAVLLPGSADNPADLADGGTTAADATNYYMIPTQTLPLLQPLESAGGFGKALYDLLEPDMRILVNLGYGDIDHGWDQGPANVPTPFGLFPTNLDWGDVFTALENGARTGFDAFEDDLSNLGSGAGSGTSTDLLGAADTTDPASFTDIVNAFSGALSHLYAALLPTADILNALVTTLPTYDIAMFTNYLEQGDLLDALGMPAAADTGLVTMALGFEAISIENAFSLISSDLSGLGLSS
jgi:hypothetical protein